MLRLSSYSILSARLANGGYALLNGLSGAMDIISEDLFGALRWRLENDDNRCIFFDDGFFPVELQSQFIERGHLTTADHETEKGLLAETAGALFNRSKVTPRFTIVPDTDCNYRCVYCFEKHLQKNTGGRAPMGAEKVASIFRAIEEIGGPNANKHGVALYGGEPLNAKNKEVVYKIVDTGRAKGYRFSAITNGHCLDKFLPLMGGGGIEEIQVTIDGSKEVHDKRRVAMDGSSSYDQIIANFRRLVRETDTQIHLRVNVDSQNAGSLEALFADLEAEGLFGIPQIVYYVSPVHGPDAAPFGNDGVEEAIRKFKIGYPKVNIGSSRRHSGEAILSGLLGKSPYQLKSAYCGAVSNMYIFLPDGSIASCLEALGRDENIIGSYSDSGVTLGGDMYELWMNRSADKIPQCIECRYCLICAGGCPQQAMDRRGSLYAPDCGDFAESYPGVLADAAERFLTAHRV